MKRVLTKLIVILAIIICIASIAITPQMLTGVKILPVVNSKFENTVQDTMDSVVHIKNVTQGWQGSGVYIGGGIILTARHVVKDGDSFEITGNDGQIVQATKAISNKKYDLGFIKIADDVSLKPAELALLEGIPVGRQVYVIGSPYGKTNFNSVTLGIISGLNRNWGDSYGWQVSFTTDSAGHPGNSGCPVFTMDGKVRGILVGGYSPVLCGCMPVDLALNDIEQIKKMFVQDDYYIEEVPVFEPFYEGYVNGWVK
jgi:S1-C subfamily serine protease